MDSFVRVPLESTKKYVGSLKTVGEIRLSSSLNILDSFVTYSENISRLLHNDSVVLKMVSEYYNIYSMYEYFRANVKMQK